MNVTELDNAEQFSREYRTRQVLILSVGVRIGIAVFVWLCVTLPSDPGWAAGSDPLFHAAFALAFVGYIYTLRRLRTESRPLRWMGLVNAIEILAISALVWRTGGTASPMTVLYLMLIMGAVFVGQVSYVLTVSLGAMSVYAVLEGLLLTGVIPHAIAFSGRDAAAEELFNSAYISTTLAVVGFFSLFTILLLMFLYEQVQRLHLTIERRRNQVSDANQALLASFHDLSTMVDRLKASEEAAQSARGDLLRMEKVLVVARLAAGNLHELRSPLTMVISELEMLLLSKSLPTEAKLKETLKKILANASRMKALLQNVEDAVRPHPEQRFVEVDLNTMVSRVVGLMAYEMKKRNVKFVASYDPAEPRILGVPSQIEQIIVNLVANAADACPERNGAVSVETQIRNAGVNLVVTDNGAGLSEDEIAKIFDPFFTTKNRSDQLGLGLYVVASIVDRHKGHISVESNPGRRTAFTVTFPMAV